jgi:hypothetical protein
MNIGSLYLVKKWSWLLFPTKETASGAALFAGHAAADVHAWYSKRFNCEVTDFPLDSIVVFLEEDGLFKKVLTSDGKIGWIWFTEIYNDSFEEMKTE